jgi:hypothetical protein
MKLYRPCRIGLHPTHVEKRSPDNFRFDGDRDLGVTPAQAGYRQCVETCRQQFSNQEQQSDCIRRRCWS